MEGTAANYSDIQVSAGDVLRFEVSGDEVFWIPTAAYTDGGNKAEDATYAGGCYRFNRFRENP